MKYKILFITVMLLMILVTLVPSVQAKIPACGLETADSFVEINQQDLLVCECGAESCGYVLYLYSDTLESDDTEPPIDDIGPVILDVVPVAGTGCQLNTESRTDLSSLLILCVLVCLLIVVREICHIQSLAHVAHAEQKNQMSQMSL